MTYGLIGAVPEKKSYQSPVISKMQERIGARPGFGLLARRWKQAKKVSYMMRKKSNTTEETLKARAGITIPELLVASFNAGKSELAAYQQSLKRIELMAEEIEEAERMIASGLQSMRRLTVTQKDSLRQDADRAAAAARSFLDLAESCRDFLECGDYSRYQDQKAIRGHGSRVPRSNLVPFPVSWQGKPNPLDGESVRSHFSNGISVGP